MRVEIHRSRSGRFYIQPWRYSLYIVTPWVYLGIWWPKRVRKPE